MCDYLDDDAFQIEKNKDYSFFNMGFKENPFMQEWIGDEI